MINKDFNFILVTIARNLRTLTKNKINSVLTFEQIRAISYISRYKGTSQKHLASVLESKQMAVSRTLESLEKLNLIYRTKNTEDKRARQLYLTTHGEYISNQIQFMSNDIYQIITKGIKKEDLNLFYDIMNKIKSNLVMYEVDETKYNIKVED